MNKDLWIPKGLPRLLSILMGCIGTLFANDIHILLGGLLIVSAPLLLMNRTCRRFLRFIAFGVLPILVMLIFIWNVLLGSPPGTPIGSDPYGGMTFSLVTGLRVATFGAIFQIGFLTISRRDLPAILYSWKLGTEWVVIIHSSISLTEEFGRRLHQIRSAQACRGLTSEHAFIRALRTPSLLAPVFAWSLRSAGERARLWDERGLIQRFEKQKGTYRGGHILGSIISILTSLGWLALNMLNFVNE